MDLLGAVRSGDRRASLEAIRDQLAATLAEADAQQVASLAKELRAVITELDSMPRTREGSKSDELAAKRATRRAAAGRAKAAGK